MSGTKRSLQQHVEGSSSAHPHTGPSGDAVIDAPDRRVRTARDRPPTRSCSTGATGYVGGRLLAAAAAPRARRHVPRPRPRRARGLPDGRRASCRGDVAPGAGLAEALDGVAGRLLPRPLDGPRQRAATSRRTTAAARRELRARAAREAGVRARRSTSAACGADGAGLGAPAQPRGGRRASSRTHVPEFVHARAAMVIGAGSASFLMLRSARRSACPRWSAPQLDRHAHAADRDRATSRRRSRALADVPRSARRGPARRRRRPHLPRDDAALRASSGPAAAADRPRARCSRRGSPRTGWRFVTPVETGARAPAGGRPERGDASCARPPPRGHQRRTAGLRRRRAAGARDEARPYHRPPDEPPAEAPGAPDRRLRRDLACAEARPGQPDDASAPRRSARSTTTRRSTATGACRSVQSADVRMPSAALDGDLDAEAPRAPGAHVLALPQPLHARPDPRRVHRGASASWCCCAARSCCSLQGARVRDGRASAGSCAGASSAACSSRRRASAPTGTWRSTCAARRPATPSGSTCTSRSRSPTTTRRSPRRSRSWVYAVTQSRIHVLVTYGFLRSLAKLDLEESRIGRFADIDELPDPSGAAPSERSAGRDARAACPSATPR